MKYTKTLLSKTSDAKPFLSRGELYEALNNEKTLEELVEIVIKNLKSIEGDVYIFKRVDEKVKILNEKDNSDEIESLIENSIVYKKIKETKKPYFEEEEGELYSAFPLNFKGRLIGGLVIKEKQKITCWEELYEYLNMLVFSFRFYQMLEKERESNIKDSITDLFNERYFRNHLEIEEEKFNRKKIPHSLLIVEIKNIQEISDTLGYEFEEKVLKKIAKIIKMQSRKVDMPAKIGRGKFAIILSHTVEEGAAVMLERIKLMLPLEVEYREKQVKLNLGYAINQFKDNQTKESFFNETLKKLS